LNLRYKKCSCGLSFLNVDFIPNRKEGYCSSDCLVKYKTSTYEKCMNNLNKYYRNPKKEK
jgi:hypothetical protein